MHIIFGAVSPQAPTRRRINDAFPMALIPELPHLIMRPLLAQPRAKPRMMVMALLSEQLSFRIDVPENIKLLWIRTIEHGLSRMDEVVQEVELPGWVRAVFTPTQRASYLHRRECGCEHIRCTEYARRNSRCGIDYKSHFHFQHSVWTCSATSGEKYSCVVEVHAGTSTVLFSAESGRERASPSDLGICLVWKHHRDDDLLRNLLPLTVVRSGCRQARDTMQLHYTHNSRFRAPQFVGHRSPFGPGRCQPHTWPPQQNRHGCRF